MAGVWCPGMSWRHMPVLTEVLMGKHGKIMSLLSKYLYQIDPKSQIADFDSGRGDESFRRFMSLPFIHSITLRTGNLA